MTQSLGLIVHLSARTETPIIDFDTAPRRVDPSNLERLMNGGIANDYLRTINGLSPRYLRNPGSSADPCKTNEAESSAGDSDASSPRTKSFPNFDVVTSELRQRILKADPQYGRLRLPSVTLPIMAALAALPWLAGQSALNIQFFANLASQLVLR
jgi:hypothetical protein